MLINCPCANWSVPLRDSSLVLTLNFILGRKCLQLAYNLLIINIFVKHPGSNRTKCFIWSSTKTILVEKSTKNIIMSMSICEMTLSNKIIPLIQPTIIPWAFGIIVQWEYILQTILTTFYSSLSLNVPHMSIVLQSHSKR